MQGSRSTLLFVLAASTTILLVALFDWTLTDWMPGLFFAPLHALAALALLVVASIAPIVVLVLARGRGAINYASLAIVLATWIALFAVPFTEVWLQLNFWWFAAARERIVAEIATGKLNPNVDYNPALIALGSDRPAVSAGGNDVVVEVHDGEQWVLFYTYRGILNHYAGFLCVPRNGNPEDYRDFANSNRRHQIVRYAPDWYWVSR